MTSVFLEFYQSMYSYHLLAATLALEVMLHICEKMIIKDDFSVGLIKQSPHGLQFGICLYFMFQHATSTTTGGGKMLFPILLSYFFNIVGIVIYLNKGTTPSNKWWGAHDYTHMFVCFADYAKIYASFRM